jgi:uncharacterized membrane protein
MTDSGQEAKVAPHRRRYRARGAWYSPIAFIRGVLTRPRLYLAIAAAVGVWYLVPPEWAASLHAASAWIAGALVYVSMTFALMAHAPEVMRQRAEREDESRFVLTVLILLAVASSFVAVSNLITDAKSADGMAKTFLLGAAGLTIVMSWLIVQIVFTLHYAHDYYRPAPMSDDDAKGMKFPGDGEPDYWDFFYFATSFGAAAQTSDVSITSKPIRRLATWHAILSFAFNTTVLAMAINMAASIAL